jgi:PAS domain S-box-containing protein
MTTQLLPSTHPTQRVDGATAKADSFLSGLAHLFGFVVVIDAAGSVRWMSEGLAELCGTDVSAPHDLHYAMSRMLDPEQAYALRSELHEHGYVSGARVGITTPSGAPLALDVSVLPLSDRADEAGLFAVIACPAERERGEGRTRRSNGFESALLAASPDALLFVDAHGDVRYANRAVASLLGYGPLELVGRPFASLCCRARDLDRVLSALIAPDAELTSEIALRRRDGAAVTLMARGGRVAFDPGPAHGLSLSLRPASSQERAVAELQHKVDDLEHCVNTLAHDLRSPLVALLGFSRLLRQDYGSRLDDTGLHFVDRIEQAGRTMETLIHDLLELSRIGQPGERRTLVDPRAVLQQLHAELKPRLDAGGIELLLPAHPPLVLCERTRLYQVFSNLIGNAIDHMGACAQPHIAVDVVEEPDAVHISVRDPGRGIAPEHHERIFEVFQTLGSRSGGHRGTGIGLAIVKRIVQSHGGRVWVDSRPGRGATFHVTFPRS